MPYKTISTPLPVKGEDYLAERLQLTKKFRQLKRLEIEDDTCLLKPITLDAINQIEDQSIFEIVCTDFLDKYYKIDTGISISGYMSNSQFICGLNIENPEKLLEFIKHDPSSSQSTVEIIDGLKVSKLLKTGGICEDNDLMLLLTTLNRLHISDVIKIGEVREGFLEYFKENIGLALRYDVIYLSEDVLNYFIKDIDIPALDTEELATVLVNLRKGFSNQFRGMDFTTSVIVEYVDGIVGTHPHWNAIKKQVLALESIAAPPFQNVKDTYMLLCSVLNDDVCAELPTITPQY